MDAKQGDRVRVHFTGSLEDGTVFDTSREREAAEFVVGSGEVIPGFEKAVLGMRVGETRTVTVPPAEAYGERQDEKVVVIERSGLPSDLEPEVGMVLEASSKGKGVIAYVKIIDVSGDNVTLDANHELAGKTLFYEIELVEIIDH